jgi:ATP-binding cassette subfamily F protein uup
LFNWNCDYATYLRRKEGVLVAENDQNATFDKKLAQEEQWIRQGVEARRTRNEGRVRALLRLRELRRERREQPGKVRLQIQEERRSGRLVIEAKGLGFAYGERAILRDFSITVQRGDRLGIIGPNGSGKTTLLRILMGELAPQAGSLRHGTHVKMGYFDQLRAQLDDDKSAYENVGQGADVVTINGKERSVIGYLEGFLFPAKYVHSPIHVLSGGERNRLVLARLFAHPANLLVLDEPTNDLDIDTLELLEDQLMAYKGTLLLVSHDRAFLNNLCTSILALDGSGEASETVGGYDDWLRRVQAENQEKAEEKPRKPAPPARPAAEPADPSAPRRLSYKEQRALEALRQELEELPRLIETLEAEQQALTARMADPAFYQQESAEIAGAASRARELEEELTRAYQRWEELEQIGS